MIPKIKSPNFFDHLQCQLWKAMELSTSSQMDDGTIHPSKFGAWKIASGTMHRHSQWGREKKFVCLQRCTNRKSILMMAFETFNGPSTPNGNYMVIRLYNNVNLRSVGQFKFIGANRYLGQYLFQKKFRIFWKYFICKLKQNH